MNTQIIIKLVCFILLTFLNFNVKGQNSGYVDSGDLQIHYTEYGKGIPVALLAGGPGASSNLMMPIIEELKNEYRFILIDQRATGKSHLENIDSTTITLDKYIEDINNVRKSLHIKEWVVLGHSWGGGLAMAVATKYPETVSNLILVGSFGIDLNFMKYSFDNLKYSKEDLDNYKYWGDSTRMKNNPKLASYERYRIVAKPRVYNKSTVNKIMQKYVFEPNQTKVIDLMINNLKTIKYDLKPQLKKFYRPSLIIQGRQGWLGGWTAFTIQQTIPNCKIEFIEKCGHYPYHEQPEAFFKVLRKYLEQ